MGKLDPLVYTHVSLEKILNDTESCTTKKNILIHLMKLSPKLKNLRTLSMKFHETEAKAISKSINKINPGLHFSLQ